MERIDLAHAESFGLGRLTVRPQLRTLARDDGEEDFLEPRVMQVLVALHRANGAILSRDDLTAACWDGRVVGEDAINRVISRLRRASEGIGAGSFRIETVTKVGYRLRTPDMPEPAPAPTPAEAATDTADRLAEALEQVRLLRQDRRSILAGSLLAVAAGGAYWTYKNAIGTKGNPAPPPEVASLMQQAMIASQQGTAEGGSQAIGLLRKTIEIRPDYADGWGMLAVAYASALGSRSPQLEDDLRARTEAAIARAREIEPGNAYAALAWVLLFPRMGNWMQTETTLRTTMSRRPGNPFLITSLAGVMLSVGRCRESADLIEQAVKIGPPSPGLLYSRVQSLWSANRLDEADRAMAEAYSLYPSHFAVWFTRFYLLLYTGRPQEALAMSRNVETRPNGIPAANFASIESVATALLSRKTADVDKAITENVALAHMGAGFAENAIQFASALGRVDTAFEIANGYYFDQGFKVPDIRFTTEQRVYTRLENRRTHFLFYPSTAAMRADKRFQQLVRQIRLNRYWIIRTLRPDYMLTQAS